MRTRLGFVALALTACSGGSLRALEPPADLDQPSTTVPTGAVAGSSPTDLWFLEQRASPNHGRLWHFDGKAWAAVPTPLFSRFATLASTRVGSVWVQTESAAGGPILFEVTVGGVVTDHSSDVNVASSIRRFHTPPGGLLYLEIKETSTLPPRLFKLVADRFELLRELPPQSGLSLVFSDDDMWLDASEPPQSMRVSKRWRGGAWVPFDAPQVIDASVSFTSATDVWIIKSAAPGEAFTFNQGNGTALVHHDGNAFTPVSLPSFGDVSRWGIVALAPGRLGVLSTAIVGKSEDSYANIEVRQWDGTQITPERVLIAHASDCYTSASQCGILSSPVRATLLDGTRVHANVGTSVGDTVKVHSSFFFGAPENY